MVREHTFCDLSPLKFEICLWATQRLIKINFLCALQENMYSDMANYGLLWMSLISSLIRLFKSPTSLLIYCLLYKLLKEGCNLFLLDVLHFFFPAGDLLYYQVHATLGLLLTVGKLALLLSNDLFSYYYSLLWKLVLI